MAYIPVRRYRNFDDPFDRFFETRLDFFDPWYDFRWSSWPRFRWITEPPRVTRSSYTSSIDTKYRQLVSRPLSSNKFRVQSDVADFNADSIKTRVDGRKVIVEAKQEDRQGENDYTIREIRKSYDLPQNAGKSHRLVTLCRPSTSFSSPPF